MSVFTYMLDPLCIVEVNWINMPRAQPILRGMVTIAMIGLHDVIGIIVCTHQTNAYLSEMKMFKFTEFYVSLNHGQILSSEKCL